MPLGEGGGEENPAEYAHVLIDAVLRDDEADSKPRVYDYRVHESLRGVVRVGHLVEVPFGNRSIRGYVVGFDSHTDVQKVRTLRRLVSEQRYLSPADIDLARWAASRYLCSPVHLLRSMLPPTRGSADGLRPPTARRLVARVTDLDEARSDLSRAPKQLAVLEIAHDLSEPVQRQELARLAEVSPSTVDALVDKGYLVWVEMPDESRPYDRRYRHDAPSELTADQSRVLDELLAACGADSPGCYLLHGVTSSGKTEVYLRVIERVLSLGRGAILMVPEISLTPQMVARVKGRLGDGVAVLHSALSPNERAGEWYRLHRGEASVALGPRSVVFAPCRDLGAIIIDEEHETTYKQDRTPRYHARSLAIKRASASGALVILGSATPCVESYQRAREGRYQLLQLPRRVDDRPMPGMLVVDMREEWKSGNRSIFSRRLHQALKMRLERGEQSVLFLNQRGYSSFLLCRECGYTFGCSDCNVTMTYHWDQKLLRCHYCDRHRELPRSCPQCSGYDLVRRGTGTQKVEAAVKSAFPGARTARLDTDAARPRGTRTRVYEAFARGELDVIVGTQMIAKGWDIPAVTLVGVVDADTALHLPDFRSAERTFQLLIQVAGRSGRGHRRGQVIVQTSNPDHPAIVGAVRGDLEEFYAGELRERRRLRYPPFASLVRIIVWGEEELLVRMWADELHRRLQEAFRDVAVSILGPAPAPLDRLRGNHRWHLLLKAECRRRCLEGLARVLHNIRMGPKDPRISVDVDPVNML